MSKITHEYVCQECGKAVVKEFNVKPNAYAVTMLERIKRCDACRAADREAFERDDAEMRQRALAQKKIFWLDSCGLPLRYRDKSFDNFDTAFAEGRHKIAWERCRQWATAFSPLLARGASSIVLWGTGYGTGKTHLAAAISHAVIQGAEHSLSCPVHFTTAADVLLRLSASRRWTSEGGSGEAEMAIYNYLQTVPLLVLDDVGKERASYDQQAFYYKVIYGRDGNSLPVVLTANIGPASLGEIIGGAAVSRLQKMAAGYWIAMSGPDYRTVEAKKEAR